MEPWLAYAHFLSIFVLFALLTGEFVLLRSTPSAPSLKLLSRLDIGYGLFAVLVLVTGVLRVFLGAIPASFWATNPVFWVKMGLFLAVGLLSVPPTLIILRWKRAHDQNGTLPDPEVWRKPARYLHAELGLLVLIPLAAVLMGR